MLIPLVRTVEREGEGILGYMRLESLMIFTIEQNWKGNQKGISCVPPGKYALLSIDSPKYGPETLTLYNPELDVYAHESDVPAAKRGKARSRILIHAANVASELKGCIAPGKRKGALYSNEQERMVQAVLDSRNALAFLKEYVNRRRPYGGAHLFISEAFTRD